MQDFPDDLAFEEEPPALQARYDSRKSHADIESYCPKCHYLYLGDLPVCPSCGYTADS
jgi:uncharacterized OB-fold protein